LVKDAFQSIIEEQFGWT